MYLTSKKDRSLYFFSNDVIGLTTSKCLDKTICHLDPWLCAPSCDKILGGIWDLLDVQTKNYFNKMTKKELGYTTTQLEINFFSLLGLSLLWQPKQQCLLPSCALSLLQPHLIPSRLCFTCQRHTGQRAATVAVN